MKIKFYILAIYLFLTQLGVAQNLISNGDFEDYTSLPVWVGEYYKCIGWSNASSPTATPDYFHSLATGPLSLPNSGFGTVSPYSGSAIMGFVTRGGTSNFREYLSTPLTSPMVIGDNYNISFWITNGESNHNCGWSSNHIGIRLSSTPLVQNLSTPIGGIPQLEIPGEVWELTWRFINFNFTADSSYNHFTIGNFYNDLSTLFTYQVFSDEYVAYYFIDKLEITPTLKIIGNSTICEGDSTILTALYDSNYSWVDSLTPNIILSNDSFLTVMPTTTTTYLIYGSNDTVSYTVNVINTPPIVNLGSDTILCQGDTLMVDASTLNSTYLWQDNSTNSSIIINQQGSYWVGVTNSCGTTSDTINVMFNSAPSISLGNDTNLCQGDTLVLVASTLNANYLWQDGSTNPTFNVNQQGSYWVGVTNSCGTKTDTINISYNSSSMINIGNDTVLCDGEMLTLNATTPYATYLWQNNTIDSTFNVTQSGIYWVTITTNCGIISDTISIIFNPTPIVSLGNDTTLCQGELLILDATTAGASYLWQDGSTNPTFNVNQQGSYWVGVTNSCGTKTDTINISYNSSSMINIGNDTVLCDGEMLTLNATTPYATYLWQNNTIDSTFNVTQSGIYWVTITTNCGIISDTISIIFNPTPIVSLGNDTTLCQGELLILDATTAGASYLWQDSSTNPINIISQQNTYWVNVTVNNCSASDTIIVDYIPLPVVDLGRDTVLCFGENLLLDVSNPTATYLWQDATTSSTYLVSQSGMYFVEVSINGCSSGDTINVFYNTLLNFDLGNDTTLCTGEILSIDATSINATYLWQDSSTSPIYYIIQNGTYWIQITNNCETINDTINVNYNLSPTISLGNDTTLCFWETIMLNATTSNGSYLWQDNSDNPVFEAVEQGIYWVQVNVDGCISNDTINVIQEDCEIILVIPNVFSPNDDGKNDFFVPTHSQGITSMHTLIYNRWGKEIFSSDKLKIEWDGTIKGGNKVSDGTYFWIISYTDIKENKSIIKGFLTVFR